MLLVLGKAKSHRAPNLGCRGADSPGWFDVSPKNCTRHDAWVSALSWWSCQSPVAHGCSFLNIRVVSAKKCSGLTQNLLQIHCSTHSVILDAVATQYTCSLNCVYCPHWLIQWSHHCSCVHIPVHSPWLPGYTEVTQTILIILPVTMARVFSDRPYVSIPIKRKVKKRRRLVYFLKVFVNGLVILMRIKKGLCWLTWLPQPEILIWPHLPQWFELLLILFNAIHHRHPYFNRVSQPPAVCW